MTSATPVLTWDIFCNVIDNYGDIGVAWRLARQLCGEYGQHIRLWVDDLHTFGRFCPRLDPVRARQEVDGIEVLYWTHELPADALPGDVVLDAFGCALPDPFLDAMASSAEPPVWINLEYLTAEDWIECCHGMVSPHPRLGLQRHFFFPGFGAKSGGVIAERDIVRKAQAWRYDPSAQARFWLDLGLTPPSPHTLNISLFCYENPAVSELLHHWAAGREPVRCLVPEGRVLTDVTAGFAHRPLQAGDTLQAGSLSLHVLPFTDQAGYDRLLWSCDINFVRGEDSFVRAQLAGRPFVWHIYPQEDAAHWVKLDAFCNRYLHGQAPETQQAMLGINHAWNHGQSIIPAWDQFVAHRADLAEHAERWPQTLLQHGDLASKLIAFINERRC
jgi:uncharacterized repeat protein (TIGR03837 family)